MNVLPGGIATLLFSEKRNADNDAPSDVVVRPHRRIGYNAYFERALYMEAHHIGGGGVRQLIHVLREVSSFLVLARSAHVVSVPQKLNQGNGKVLSLCPLN